MNIRQATSKDYKNIIELQNANTLKSLRDDKNGKGFLDSSMDNKQLDAINQALGILVAIEDDQLVGFICMTPQSFNSSHPVVKAMYKSFRKQEFNGKLLIQQRVFTYGPVCISKMWRGKGILKRLFAAVKEYTHSGYDVGVAFIDQRNPYSLAAHIHGLNMTDLALFECKSQIYHLVAFSTN